MKSVFVGGVMPLRPNTVRMGPVLLGFSVTVLMVRRMQLSTDLGEVAWILAMAG